MYILLLSMLHLSTVLKHYKRADIQEAMVLAAENREVSVRFGDGGFGKRPDTLVYPNDVLAFVKQGATSFHISEERWTNPLHIVTGMTKKQLDEIRRGWDLVIDIDCVLWDYSKLIAHFVVQELKLHGITSVTAKFSGNKGFHIGVPFESFPHKVHGQPTSFLFPDGVRRVAQYLVEKIKPKLFEYIEQKDSFSRIAQALEITEDSLYKTICTNCKKQLKEQKKKIEFICISCENKEEGLETEKFKVCSKCQKIMNRLEADSVVRCPYCRLTSFETQLDLNPLLQVDTVLISSRHLYRMPYSLHEKSGLCSIPIDPNQILSFEKEMAKPELVTVNFGFLNKAIPDEANKLLLEAFDYFPAENSFEEKKKWEKAVIGADLNEEKIQQMIPAEFFPPCMKIGLLGLQDGKKRFLFVVVNFLLSCGYDYATIDALLEEWNKKNPEPLREVIWRGQVRYAQQTQKKIMPPNCDNKAYYVDLQICKPDGICGRIKNPVQYAKRKQFLANLDIQREAEKGIREPRLHLTNEQKEMRKKFREGKKEEKESD